MTTLALVLACGGQFVEEPPESKSTWLEVAFWSTTCLEAAFFYFTHGLRTLSLAESRFFLIYLAADQLNLQITAAGFRFLDRPWGGGRNKVYGRPPDKWCAQCAHSTPLGFVWEDFGS